MPFQRPTLKELRARAIADLDSRLPGSDARLRRSNTGVIATVHAGAVHGLHGHLEYISEQIMPDTAEDEFLQRWASIWKVPLKSAEPSKGTITLTGNNGANIDAGTELQRSDGVLFITDVAVVIAAGTASVAVTAREAGSACDTEAGSTLTLTSPVSGVSPSATVAAGGITGGADVESNDDLRARVLYAIRNPPHGGASFDYVQWALEIAEVTRAWCYPQFLGDGTVGVAVVCDNQLGTIIPDQEVIDAVQEHIDYLRPVTADVTVFAPIAKPRDFTIILNPTDPLVQAAVQAELQDLITREAVPNGTIYLSHFHEAISIAVGEVDHTLVSPTEDETCLGGEITVMGVITWA